MIKAFDMMGGFNMFSIKGKGTIKASIEKEGFKMSYEGPVKDFPEALTNALEILGLVVDLKGEETNNTISSFENLSNWTFPNSLEKFVFKNKK